MMVLTNFVAVNHGKPIIFLREDCLEGYRYKYSGTFAGE
jgi:hypothetical protein